MNTHIQDRNKVGHVHPPIDNQLYHRPQQSSSRYQWNISIKSEFTGVKKIGNNTYDLTFKNTKNNVILVSRDKPPSNSKYKNCNIVEVLKNKDFVNLWNKFVIDNLFNNNPCALLDYYDNHKRVINQVIIKNAVVKYHNSSEIIVTVKIENEILKASNIHKDLPHVINCMTLDFKLDNDSQLNLLISESISQKK